MLRRLLPLCFLKLIWNSLFFYQRHLTLNVRSIKLLRKIAAFLYYKWAHTAWILAFVLVLIVRYNCIECKVLMLPSHTRCFSQLRARSRDALSRQLHRQIDRDNEPFDVGDEMLQAETRNLDTLVVPLPGVACFLDGVSNFDIFLI